MSSSRTKPKTAEAPRPKASAKARGTGEPAVETKRSARSRKSGVAAPQEESPRVAVAAPLPSGEDAPPTLEACRERIDSIDEGIIELLNRRARVARQVGRLKAEKGAEVYDAGRHLQLLNGVARRGSGDFPREGLRIVYGEILSACLNLQAPQTIAYLGPAGTFSNIAATRAFGRSARLMPRETIPDIFRTVQREQAHFGIVPVENSTGGVIHATLDALIESDLSICAEIYIPVRHNLLCAGPRRGIRRICTHPQILSQCRGWIRENMAGVELMEVASSAEGARMASRSKSVATIGPSIAAETYGLKILEAGIEDQKDNVTRFLVIGRQSPRPTGSDRTSVMFSIKDEPGALFGLLEPFARRRINLTKIESRPTRRRAWDYMFFLDVEGHVSTTEIREAIDELGRRCTFLRVLGSYPVERENQWTR